MEVFRMGALSYLSQAGFMGVVLLVLGMHLVGYRKAFGTRGMAIGTGLLVGWMAIHTAVVASGVLESMSIPPPGMLYLGTTTAVVVSACLSRLGKRLSELPFSWLIGFQAFRLPLELVLHQIHSDGALPEAMTFMGYNFDILTGVTAALLFWRADTAPKGLIWAWNCVGIALLITVVSIAVLSGPFPFRQIFQEPATTLVFNIPTHFIASILVMSALAGHILVFRKLRASE